MPVSQSKRPPWITAMHVGNLIDLERASPRFGHTIAHHSCAALTYIFLLYLSQFVSSSDRRWKLLICNTQSPSHLDRSKSQLPCGNILLLTTTAMRVVDLLVLTSLGSLTSVADVPPWYLCRRVVWLNGTYLSRRMSPPCKKSSCSFKTDGDRPPLLTYSNRWVRNQGI